MQKKISRLGLTMMIFLGVFVVLGYALLFIIPVADGILGIGEAGPGYVAIDVIVGGLKAFVSFDFANVWYIVTFVVAIIVVLSIIYWFIVSIVRKARFNWITFALSFVFGIAAVILVAAMTIAPVVREAVNEVYKTGDAPFAQYLIRDLFGEYASMPMPGTDPVEGIFIFYNQFTFILGFVMFALAVAGVTLVLFNSIYVPIYLFLDEEYLAAKREAKLAAQRKREQDLITYVDYMSGKEFRDREYEALCAANGIAVKGKKVENEEDAYYRELAKELAVLRDEKNIDYSAAARARDENKYYEETAKKLAILHRVEQPKEEVDYKALAKELGILEKPAKNEEQRYEEIKALLEVDDGSYYEDLSKELSCLQYQKPPVEPKIK